MKINNECARKILIEIEKIPYGETLTVTKLQEKISIFSIEEIINIITILNKEMYIVVLNKPAYDDNDVLTEHKIKCLTDRGYKALDTIREDETWNNLKENITNFDNISIFTIFDIANKIMSVKYNKLFNLPENLITRN